MLKLIVMSCALCAILRAPAADPAGIVRRAPLANARHAFETTGKGRVAFLGGSITEMPGWRVKVMKGLQERFPKTKFEFVCAGLSSTCSDTGAYRLQEDVLSKGTPDLIFVEYAVNDDGDGYYLAGRHDPKTYEAHILRGVEGVVRQLRQHSRRTDIVMTFFVSAEQIAELRAGKTPKAYAIDGKVAKHYGVTTVSVGEALAAAEKEGSFDWRRYGGDCHPHEPGCVFVNGLYGKLFDAEWGAPAPKGFKDHALPAPLDPLSYAKGRFLGFDRVTRGEGWTVGPVDWSNLPGGCRPNFREGDYLFSDTVGATCSFEFKGTSVGAFLLAGTDTGSLEVSIDGGEFVSFMLYTRYSAWLHYPFVETFADGLKDTKHRVVLRVGNDRDDAAKGGWVRIYRLCVNGEGVGK